MNKRHFKTLQDNTIYCLQGAHLKYKDMDM